MKNKKHKQRQEVRRILAEVRKELNEYQVNYEDIPDTRSARYLDQVATRVQSKPRRKEAY